MVEKNKHASNPSSMSIWGIKIIQYASQHWKSLSETDTGGLLNARFDLWVAFPAQIWG